MSSLLDPERGDTVPGTALLMFINVEGGGAGEDWPPKLNRKCVGGHAENTP